VRVVIYSSALPPPFWRSHYAAPASTCQRALVHPSSRQIGRTLAPESESRVGLRSPRHLQYRRSVLLTGWDRGGVWVSWPYQEYGTSACGFNDLGRRNIFKLRHYRNLDPLDHVIWMALDQHMMDSAKAIIVCMLEGWETSYGVTEEIKYFHNAGKQRIDMAPGSVPPELL